MLHAQVQITGTAIDGFLCILPFKAGIVSVEATQRSPSIEYDPEGASECDGPCAYGRPIPVVGVVTLESMDGIVALLGSFRMTGWVLHSGKDGSCLVGRIRRS